MSWKEKVQSLMNKKGLSQKDLSKLSGIAESSVSRYMRSDKKPRIDVLINFAKALEIDPEYLLEESITADSAFNYISTAIARKGNELTPEEKNKLIALIIGMGK